MDFATAIVTKTVRVHAPVADVWAALTQAEWIAQWLNDVHVETTWTVGAPIAFRGEWAGKPLHDQGIVLQFEPQRILQYTHWSSWSPLPYSRDNSTLVTMIVTPDHDAALVEFRHEHFHAETEYRHANWHWSATAAVFKDLVEAGQFSASTVPTASLRGA